MTLPLVFLCHFMCFFYCVFFCFMLCCVRLSHCIKEPAAAAPNSHVSCLMSHVSQDLMAPTALMETYKTIGL